MCITCNLLTVPQWRKYCNIYATNYLTDINHVTRMSCTQIMMHNDDNDTPRLIMYTELATCPNQSEKETTTHTTGYRSWPFAV